MYDAGVCCAKKARNIDIGKQNHKIFDLFLIAEQIMKIDINANTNECW